MASTSFNLVPKDRSRFQAHLKTAIQQLKISKEKIEFNRRKGDYRAMMVYEMRSFALQNYVSKLYAIKRTDKKFKNVKTN